VNLNFLGKSKVLERRNNPKQGVDLGIKFKVTFSFLGQKPELPDLLEMEIRVLLTVGIKTEV